MSREPTIPPVRCAFAEEGPDLEELLRSSLRAWVRGRLRAAAGPVKSGRLPDPADGR